MADVFNWKCPFCNHDSTITHSNHSIDTHIFEKGNKDGNLGIWSSVTVCPNDECKEYMIEAMLFKVKEKPGSREFIHPPLMRWQLRPQSKAKPFPAYIPQ